MKCLNSAKRTFLCEINALKNLLDNIDDTFSVACDIIYKTKGRIIIMGTGKSGHIGAKIAATLSSTGTPSFFIHPTEAGHGDFGMITKNDCIIAISNSGMTSDMVSLIPLIKHLGINLIAITSNTHSILAKESDVVLNLHNNSEACPHNLAPTNSTTCTLVLGDALAIATLERKKFTLKDFAFSHPSGSLGKRLLLKVTDIMRKEDAIPTSYDNDTLQTVILEISSKKLGCSFILDHKTDQLIGIFTDGDLRRILINKKTAILQEHIKKYMHVNPKYISSSVMAIDALDNMHKNRVSVLAIVNDKGALVGATSLHDLISAGL